MIRRARHAINDLRAEIEPRLPRRGTLRWLWAGEHGERPSGPSIAPRRLLHRDRVALRLARDIRHHDGRDRGGSRATDALLPQTRAAHPRCEVRCRRRYDDMGFAPGKSLCRLLLPRLLPPGLLARRAARRATHGASPLSAWIPRCCRAAASRSVRTASGPWRERSSALAAGMLKFILLDLVVQFVIVEWQ